MCPRAGALISWSNVFRSESYPSEPTVENGEPTMYLNRVFARLAFAGLSLAVAPFLQAGEVIIKGSDTMLVMNQQLAQAYMQLHPETDIQVAGGGSGVGIAALHDNTADIGACSRDLRPTEIKDFLFDGGMRPACYSAAMDGVAIFVNIKNPLKELTVEQLRRIFRGDYTNWRELGGPDMAIDVYSRDNTSGTYAFIKDEVLDGDDYTTHAETLPGTAAVYHSVSIDPRGIGYGGIGYNKGVKVLKLKADDASPAYWPTKESVYDRSYPLSRTLNYYLNPRSRNDEAVKFVLWVRSPEGQKIVVKSNYFALPEMLKYTAGVVGTEDLDPHSVNAPPAPLNSSAQRVNLIVSAPPPATSLSASPLSTSLTEPLSQPSAPPAALLPKNSEDNPKQAADSAPLAIPRVDSNDLAGAVAILSQSENKIAAVEAKLVDRETQLDERETKLDERQAELNAEQVKLEAEEARLREMATKLPPTAESANLPAN